MDIAENYYRLRREIPEYVTIVAAVKTRTPDEILSLIDAGGTDIGENYVQEAEKAIPFLGEKTKTVRWHMLGGVQKNKINKAIELFDVIQTVDSLKTASEINKRAAIAGKTVSVYMEINIASEEAKQGFIPDEKALEKQLREIALLKNMRVEGIMTMGAFGVDDRTTRQYFRKTCSLFKYLKTLNVDNTDIKILSMGMSDSYELAIEEGANMVRLGTVLFGERKI